MIGPRLKRAYTRWRPCIGVEIHAQLNTPNKLFSNALVGWQAPINSQVALFDSAVPGTLPRLNWDCVRLAIQAALVTDCDIATDLVFDRKHYEYHDLPAGYQITQHRHPLARNGKVFLGNSIKPIRIRQIHLEQDTAKSFHTGSGGRLIDLNRSGVGLIEIVSEPDMDDAGQAAEFVQHLHALLQDTRVCSGNLEQGAMRVDVNVNLVSEDNSIRTALVELKNLNGLDLIRAAITCEISRQLAQLANSDSVPSVSQTRLYLPERDETVLLRAKERSTNYRHLPEFDLPLFPLNSEFIADIRANTPKTRFERINRLRTHHPQLPAEILQRLWTRPGLPEFFDSCVILLQQQQEQGPKVQFLLNWCVGELMAACNKTQFSTDKKLPLSPQSFINLVLQVRQQQLDKELAKSEIIAALTADRDLHSSEPVMDHGHGSNHCWDISLDQDIDDLFSKHQSRVEYLQSPEGKARGGSVDFFIGPLMEKYRGKLHPTHLKSVLQQKIKEK